MRYLLISVVAAALLACQAAPTPSGYDLSGSWGGDHVGLDLNAQGGRLEYDCAAGAIDEPVRPDAAGTFVARGTHVPSLGGPERVDQPRPRLPAEYRGRVRGDLMTLTVHTPDGVLGPFGLERGATPSILRCL